MDQYQRTTANTPANEEAKKQLADLARGFGIECIDGREWEDDLACAIALVLFSDTGTELPGNYSSNELSPDSPIRLLTSFPQELILLGRATVLLKGIARRLEVPLSLVERWGDECRSALESSSSPTLPLWAGGTASNVEGNAFVVPNTTTANGKIRLRQVGSLFRLWGKGKTKRLGMRLLERMPNKLRTPLLEYVVTRQERKEKAKRVAAD